MVPSSAAANTAKGAIQATRSKPCVVGAASTVAPYLAAKLVRICSSVAPEAMAALSSSRIWPDEGQPTWLHSPSNWAQLQVHMRRWPRSLKRRLALVAPVEKQTAMARSTACAVLRRKAILLLSQTFPKNAKGCCARARAGAKARDVFRRSLRGLG